MTKSTPSAREVFNGHVERIIAISDSIAERSANVTGKGKARQRNLSKLAYSTGINVHELERSNPAGQITLTQTNIMVLLPGRGWKNLVGLTTVDKTLKPQAITANIDPRNPLRMELVDKKHLEFGPVSLHGSNDGQPAFRQIELGDPADDADFGRVSGLVGKVIGATELILDGLNEAAESQPTSIIEIMRGIGYIAYDIATGKAVNY